MREGAMADHIQLGQKWKLGSRRAVIAPALLAMLTIGCAAQPSLSVIPTSTAAPVATDPDALRARLAPLVLQPEDLAAIGKTSDFQRFDEGPLLRADQPAGARSDPRRFGRLGGWKARYRRADPAATEGALIIESRVDLFSDASGAIADLEALGVGAPRTGASVATLAPSIGEASVALVNEQAADRSIAYYAVAWRRGPLLASVLVSGFKGEVSLADASTLAAIVDRRLAAANGG